MHNKVGTILLGLLVACIFSVTARAAEVTYYHTDAMGTPLAISHAQGKVVWKGDYLPFGEEYDIVSNPEKNKRRFVGKEKDEESGLHYFGARYMDEKSGRFISPDPVYAVDPATSKTNTALLTNPLRLNRYVYGLNNPYRYVDPDGLAPSPVNQELREQYSVTAAVNNAQSVARKIILSGAMAVMEMGVMPSASGVIATSGVKPTADQLKNIGRFEKKLPANAKDSLAVKPLPNNGVAVQATSPGRAPGSSAVYEKQIDEAGTTIQYTKTTYDPAGNIVHVKDKLNGGVFP